MNTIFERILRNTSGNLELRRMVWNPNGRGGVGAYNPPSERLFSRKPQKIGGFLNNGSGDVFHGVATRKPGTTRGGKTDVYEVVCLQIDVDFKTTSREKFEETLKNFRDQPTIIVDSGNGRHLYWFLKAPILLNGDTCKVSLIEGINRGLGKYFSGDHTHNIDRILRSPGRTNSKWPNSPLCKILVSDGPDYNLADLEIYAGVQKSPQGTKLNLGHIPDELPQGFKKLLAKNRVVQATWNGERVDLQDESGSGYDMTMVANLAHRGFTPEEIASVLRAMPSGKGRDASQSYLEHTIAKAFASIGESENNIKDGRIVHKGKGASESGGYEGLEAFAASAVYRVEPVLGFWQDVLPNFADASFDGILFDTYPLEAGEIHQNHYSFFVHARRLLKPGGDESLQQRDITVPDGLNEGAIRLGERAIRQGLQAEELVPGGCVQRGENFLWGGLVRRWV